MGSSSEPTPSHPHPTRPTPSRSRPRWSPSPRRGTVRRDRSGQVVWHILWAVGQLAFIGLLVWWSGATFLAHDHAVSHDTSQGGGIPYRHWRRTALLVARVAQQEAIDTVWVIDRLAIGSPTQRLATLRYLVGEKPRLVSTADARGEALVMPAEADAAALVAYV